MVKVKEQSHLLSDGSVDLDAWLRHLEQHYQHNDLNLIRNASVLSQLAGLEQATESGESCLQQGLAMAEILADLNLDQETLAAAIVYESVQYAELNIDDVQEQLGEDVANLVAGVERMAAINNLSSKHRTTRSQLENIRKMLIAMVDDVRVVIIKLAERLRVLRTCSHMPKAFREQVAHETMNIYAPLANRLGIGQLKWELEDLAFRYLETEKYKEIASGLKARRLDRDRYVKDIVNTIADEIQKLHIQHAHVYGRAKHIHSIYRKMIRKNIDINQIYDATAVRVLVDSVEQCYSVLSLVHKMWERIPEEFDDYIANPKANGYRSLHTAVIGPEERSFEVQIRTREMHDNAEKGVAAHWLYKEGGDFKQAAHERKIEWLLQVLAWQKDIVTQGGLPGDIDTEFFEDRVYIFTPTGDIVDLPKGSTPLDFAYHVHSEVGHRCRGSKIDGKIAPLTYQLKTGEQVEILTGNEAKPSRDWLNSHLGYLKSSRAKAKVHHWFKLQDYDVNRASGLQIMERECRKLHIDHVDYNTIAKELNFKQGDDVLAALGRGDLRLAQIMNRILPSKETQEKPKPPPSHSNETPTTKAGIQIAGVSNLLTHIARCCHPVPGDDIIGYITIGRGISIHRKDCNNVLNATEHQQQRFLDVEWSDYDTEMYPVDITVTAHRNDNLQRDITTLIHNQHVFLLRLNTFDNAEKDEMQLALTIKINNLATLSRIIDKIQALEYVIKVERVIS